MSQYIVTYPTLPTFTSSSCGYSTTLSYTAGSTITTTAATTIANLSIPFGIWLVIAVGSVTSGGNANGTYRMSISGTTNSIDESYCSGCTSNGASGNLIYLQVSRIIQNNSTSATTYYLVSENFQGISGTSSNYAYQFTRIA